MFLFGVCLFWCCLNIKVGELWLCLSIFFFSVLFLVDWFSLWLLLVLLCCLWLFLYVFMFLWSFEELEWYFMLNFWCLIKFEIFDIFLLLLLLFLYWLWLFECLFIVIYSILIWRLLSWFSDICFLFMGIFL